MQNVWQRKNLRGWIPPPLVARRLMYIAFSRWKHSQSLYQFVDRNYDHFHHVSYIIVDTVDLTVLPVTRSKPEILSMLRGHYCSRCVQRDGRVLRGMSVDWNQSFPPLLVRIFPIQFSSTKAFFQTSALPPAPFVPFSMCSSSPLPPGSHSVYISYSTLFPTVLFRCPPIVIFTTYPLRTQRIIVQLHAIVCPLCEKRLFGLNRSICFVNKRNICPRNICSRNTGLRNIWFRNICLGIPAVFINICYKQLL